MEQARSKTGSVASAIGVALNLALGGAKLAVGILCGASSIVADAVNNLEDAASSLIGIIGFRLAGRPADDGHPFGHARYEYITGLVVAFLVLLAGVELLKTGITRCIEPGAMAVTPLMLLTLVASILVKTGMWAYQRHMGKRIASDTLLAVARDSLLDAIATGAVLLGALLTRWTGLDLDGYVTILVALFILYNGIGMVRDATRPLLGAAPDADTVRDIEGRILSYPGVLGAHDLMIHDYGPGRRFASVHVELPAEKSVLECHELIDGMEQDFFKNDHLQMIIHCDPVVTSDAKLNALRGDLEACLKEYGNGATIHDLAVRTVRGETTVSFDCLLPDGNPERDAMVQHALERHLLRQYPGCHTLIRFDHSFVALDDERNEG